MAIDNFPHPSSFEFTIDMDANDNPDAPHGPRGPFHVIAPMEVRPRAEVYRDGAGWRVRWAGNVGEERHMYETASAAVAHVIEEILSAEVFGRA